jgi:hypothetical protein
MEREGVLDPGQRRAGERFHDLFRYAHLDRLFAADMSRLGVILANGSNVRDIDGDADARQMVLAAIDLLGGLQSPGGSCAWHVLGCEMSLGRWALSVGWSGRRLHPKMASGILQADLGVLRRHWGM